MIQQRNSEINLINCLNINQMYKNPYLIIIIKITIKFKVNLNK